MTQKPTFTKEFSSSILLWIRKGMTVPEGKAYWAGGHAQIIAASKASKNTASSTSAKAITASGPVDRA